MAVEAPAFESRVHEDVDIHRFVPHQQTATWMVDTRAYALDWTASLRVEVGPHVAPDYDVFCSAKLVDGLFVAKVRHPRFTHTRATLSRRCLLTLAPNPRHAFPPLPSDPSFT